MQATWKTRTRRFIIQSLWLLLALGPFLHAHFGASHYEGFHDDTIQRIAGLSKHLHTECSVETSEIPESPAIAVGNAMPREWEQAEEGDHTVFNAQLLQLASLLWQLAPTPDDSMAWFIPATLVRPDIWAAPTPPAQAPPAQA
jgi:hypothetical protein